MTNHKCNRREGRTVYFDPIHNKNKCPWGCGFEVNEMI
jgi:hypothetical protein